MIHLRPLPSRYMIDKIKRETTQRLKDEIAEQKMDSRLPRHFQEREHFRRTGEIKWAS